MAVDDLVQHYLERAPEVEPAVVKMAADSRRACPAGVPTGGRTARRMTPGVAGYVDPFRSLFKANQPAGRCPEPAPPKISTM